MRLGSQGPKRQRFGAAMLAIVCALAACSSEDEESADPFARADGPIEAPDSLRIGDAGRSSATERPLSAPDAFTTLVQETEKRTYAFKVFDLARDRTLCLGAIEIMGFTGLSGIDPLTPEEMAILRRLSGQSFANGDWESWLQWWWNQSDIRQHAGYAHLKRHLFSRIDPKYTLLMAPDEPATIDRSEILLRGLPPGGPFSELIDPEIVAGKSPDAGYMINADLVIGIEVGGETRAYPLRMLNYHEVVSDTLGGEPIVVTYNPLTRSAFAYRRRVDDGEALEFGPTGLMYRSETLMYDAETKSLWLSRNGRPVVGRLATGPDSPALEPLPVVQSTWYVWKNTYPETTTLSVETGHEDAYGEPEPYQAYYDGGRPGFALKRRDHRLEDFTQVLGLVVNGDAVAYPYSELEPFTMVHDIVGGEKIVILSYIRRNEFRAYRMGERIFVNNPSPFHVEEIETQSLWRITEQALIYGSPISAALRMERVPSEVTRWYAWQLWHPETRIFKADQEGPVMARFPGEEETALN